MRTTILVRLSALKRAQVLVYLGMFVLLVAVLSASNTAKVDAKPKALVSKYQSGQLLVKFKDSTRTTLPTKGGSTTGVASVDRVLKGHKLKGFERLVNPSKKSAHTKDIFAWYMLTLDPLQPDEKIVKDGEVIDITLQELKAKLARDPNVEAVEENFVVTSDVVPNDPYYASSGTWGQTYNDTWGLRTIHAENAWDSTTGSSVVIANIDTGLYTAHPDIAANVWSNAGEIPGNKVDDDGNGYVDDVNGWNWVGANANINDDNGHGTHTAGTIAAVGNNGVGITGVAWNAKVMPLKFLDSNGNGNIDNGAKALVYAADMGARIASNSWGCGCNSQVLEDAVRYEHDKNMVTVVAAGNNYGADALNYAPADNDGVITVGASDVNNQIADFSNVGQRIDVVAPGVDILSLRSAVGPVCGTTVTVGGSYCRLSGTSMATPHVSGLAALLVSRTPALGNEEVRQLLRANTTDLGAPGRDVTFGFGLIDAGKAVAAAVTAPPTAYISYPGSRTVLGAQAVSIVGSVGGANFQSYKLEVGLGRAPSSYSTLATGTTAVQNGVLGSWDPTTYADGSYRLRLTVTDTTGKQYVYDEYDIQVDNVDAELLSPQNVVSLGQNAIIGSVGAKNGLTVASYTLDYGTGTNPTSFSQVGITSTAATSVTAGQLGTWDTTSLISGQTYTVRLTVVLINGIKTVTTISLVADKDLAAGWPKYMSGTACSGDCGGTPAFVDLDGNGTKEMVIATPGSNTVFAYNRNGSIVTGFPVSVAAGDWFTWPVTTADINNDGKPELIASAVTATGATRVYIINHDGSLYAGWPMPVYQSATGGSFDNITPTVADLDGDGVKELVTLEIYWPASGSVIHKLHAVHLDGSEISGFPKDVPVQNSFMQAALTIADLDRDSKPEIAFGNYDKFYLLDNQGNVLPGWPYTAPQINAQTETFQTTPAVGDIDGDGSLEVFATATPNGTVGAQLPLYGWKKDGAVLSGWPQMTGAYGSYHVGWPLNNIATTDVNNDGKDEVIVGFNNVTTHTLSGTLPMSGAVGLGSVSLGDVNGDGVPEISAGRMNTTDGIELLNSSGAVYWKNDNIKATGSFYNPFVLADMDNNGMLEYAGVLTLTSRSASLAYLWEIPGVASSPTDSWSMYGHDAANTNHLTLGSRPFNDTVAPTVSLTSPAAGATLANTANVTATASDNVGVTKVEFYVDGVLAATDTSAPYSYGWNTSTVANGSHTLRVKAYDAASLSTATNTISVTVANADTTPPKVSLTSPAAGATLANTVNVTATASDNVGVTKVEFYVDGSLAGLDTTAPYSYSWDTLTVANGAHTLIAVAYDAANLAATTSSMTVTVANADITAPTITITAPANNSLQTKNTTITITATASDNVGVTKVEFYVDGALKCTDMAAPYTCAYKLSSKAGVSATILAKAYDARNNTSSISSKVTTK